MKILAFLSTIFFTSNAFAYTRHSDPAAIFVATIIFSVIFLLLSLGIEKITGFVLKLFDPNIWKTAKTQSTPNKHKKTKKINLKTCLTLFICYEIAIILILADSYDACDFIFSYDFCIYDGFQYLVMCLFVPALIAVIVMWKQEIKNFLKRIWQIISK